MKCRSCRQPAVIEVRRHNAGFCHPCFVRHCRDQVARTVEHFDMIGTGDRVLVAVSGGKDSLALWDLLLDSGVAADGLYLGLGIGDYSGSSREYARGFAGASGGPAGRGRPAGRLRLRHPDGAKAARRAPCSACGLSKRHLFNQAALDGGYDVLATGHNLDDEAAVLFGNVLRWDLRLPGPPVSRAAGGNGFVRKVKPLVRLGERETAAYCVLQGIDYIVEECPMAAGNRHLGYKEALNGSRRRRRGRRRRSTSASSTGSRPWWPARGRAGEGGPAPLPRVRVADGQRGLRLLQAGGAGGRAHVSDLGSEPTGRADRPSEGRGDP